jgi:hypothetical protein
MADNKEIVARLTLDSKEFTKGASDAAKDLAKIGAGLSVLQASFTAAAVSSANFAAQTEKMANIAGVTTSEFSKLQYAAKTSGVSAEDLAKALGKIRTPTDDAKFAFKQLGISTTDASGKMKDQQQVLGELADKYKGFSDPVTKAKASVLIFGNENDKLNGLLEKGSVNIKKMADEAFRFGQTVSESAAKEASKFNDDIALLGTGLQGLTNVIGESVVAFTNQSGVMKIVQDVIAGLIESWRALSDSQKNAILTVVSLAAAFGALLIGAAALSAVIPSLVAGFALLTGPIGLAVVAIGALTAAFLYLENQKKAALNSSNLFLENYDKENQKIQELGGSYRELEGKKSSSVISNGNVRKSLQELDDIAKKYNVSMVDQSGNYRKLADVMAEVNQQRAREAQLSLAALGMAESRLRADIANLEVAMSSANAITRVTGAYQVANLELEKRKKILDETIQSEIKLARAIQDANSPIKVPEARKSDPNFLKTVPEIQYKSEILAAISDVDKARALSNSKYALSADEKKKLEEEALAAQIKTVGGITQQAVAYSKLAASVAQAAQQMIKPFADLSSTIAEGIKRDADVMNRDFEVAIARMAKAHEEEMEAFLAAEEAKQEAIAAGYDAQIAAIQQGEDQKNAVLDRGMNERLLMLNEEYRLAAEAAEAAYQARIQKEQEEYELRRDQLIQDSIDKEEAVAATDLADEDHRQYLLDQQALHDQAMADLAKNFKNQSDAVTKEQNANKVKSEEDAKAKIKALTDAKNAELKAAEDQKNKDMNALEVAQQAAEDALKKQQLQKQWEAEVDAYNATKAVKIAETITAGIVGAAQAFAALAPIPFIGPALGAAAAAVIIGTVAARVDQIASFTPIKPAGLFLEDGGFIGGNTTHAQGGIAATVESREAVIDKERSQDIIDFVDSGLSNQGGIKIYFQAGSIVTGDSIIDERTIDLFSNKFAERIQRYGGK